MQRNKGCNIGCALIVAVLLVCLAVLSLIARHISGWPFFVRWSVLVIGAGWAGAIGFVLGVLGAQGKPEKGEACDTNTSC